MEQPKFPTLFCDLCVEEIEAENGKKGASFSSGWNNLVSKFYDMTGYTNMDDYNSNHDNSFIELLMGGDYRRHCNDGDELNDGNYNDGNCNDGDNNDDGNDSDNDDDSDSDYDDNDRNNDFGEEFY
ncbi:hypothetical protein SO802_002345 [Lithocarpus litseifolius]|uniref:Uncharacterized protein n=1 Tax=Lithocarpus litseifolius TaxID=425828 RepID=A0AAW2E2L2_9ROSI